MVEDYALGVLKRAHITAFGAHIRARPKTIFEQYIVVKATASGSRRRATLEPHAKGNWPNLIVMEPAPRGHWHGPGRSSAFETRHHQRAWMTLDSTGDLMDAQSTWVILYASTGAIEPQSEGMRWLDDKLTQAVMEVEMLTQQEISHVRVKWIGIDDPISQSDPQAYIGPTAEAAKLPSPKPPENFAPSSALVDFWSRGLEAHRAEARRGVQSDQHLEFLQRQTKEELAHSFTVRLRRMFSILGNRHRHGIDDYQTVASGGRFLLEVQYHVLDRVQICPDESSEFFSRLYSELADYLSRGGRIAGSWGELVLTGDMIEIATKPERLDTEDPWEQAKLLE